LTKRAYQYGFSRDNAAMHSLSGRQRKAGTMLAVLGEAMGDRLARATILNVGCSTGIVDEFLAPHVGNVTGIDIDEAAIRTAQERCKASNSAFSMGDAMNLRFKDSSFDVVICAQVYEHVPDSARMMGEIHRVLVPGGLCYFAATNRFCVVEQHYQLPFLSAIPIPLAHWYLRLLRRGLTYHERHLSLAGLRGLTSQFAVEDFTLRILADPDRYQAAYMLGSGLKLGAARILSKMAYGLFPGYIWLLSRRSS
jgi:SAM-dependent methyltransferase